jgi:Fic family protein
METALRLLPFDFDIETLVVHRNLVKAHKALAELKGVASSIPDQSILINTLSLQEAKDSSAIENIITTHDELYRSDTSSNQFANPAAKEVRAYADALHLGFDRVKRSGLILNKDIVIIQERVVENSAGFRKLPGTVLRNSFGETVYTPPQHPDEILRLMGNLEQFINDPTICDWDPLTKMAIMHLQFETIHPFYDGNGRTGRIINILYLVQQGLLDIPILYLSRYINKNKLDYYQFLQAARIENSWQAYVIFMLNGIESTSLQTLSLIKQISEKMRYFESTMRDKLPRVYSIDLLNNLFRHPYTKIEFVSAELGVHRNTATKYLDEIVKIGLLSKRKIGRDNFYINDTLFNLLSSTGETE